MAVPLFLPAACAAPTPAPVPPSVPSSTPAVEPVAFAVPAGAQCAWVEASSTNDHAVPDRAEASPGHWEIRICGAPPGDTSGMGGPVDWRFVPDAAETDRG